MGGSCSLPNCTASAFSVCSSVCLAEGARPDTPLPHQARPEVFQCCVTAPEACHGLME